MCIGSITKTFTGSLILQLTGWSPRNRDQCSSSTNAVTRSLVTPVGEADADPVDDAGPWLE